MSKELPPFIDPVDDCPWLPARTLFRRLGYEPLPPSAVDDFHTNHLTDRELYTQLWSRGLREAALLPGKIKTGGWYYDCIGSGSEEDIEL
jgi:hypothetical protein